MVLGVTPETVVPGRYGLWIEDGFGHVRIGDVLGIDTASGTVERELVAVDRGYLAPGPARWNQYYYGASAGREHRCADRARDVCR